ncbi:hypothetical protein MVEN_00140100 [Mycena venus]|uniref:Uncharacterized protein n=1 Tax=Mycena venus TaxID=2733690 RepID=A0A8H6YW59_9AGAR|nr:hypothetical protein MVEN_00140100 [Mycena venus]
MAQATGFGLALASPGFGPGPEFCKPGPGEAKPKSWLVGQAKPGKHYAPYNFGINRAWFERYKDHPQYAPLLEDWDQYIDPGGLGTSQHASGVGAAAGHVEEELNAQGATSDED